MNDRPLSVTEFIQQIKEVVEGHFPMMHVVGEVSNLSGSSAGHFYFSISDDESSVAVALFRMDALRNPLIRTIKNGDKIIVTGPIAVYGKKGTFQLLAKRIMPFGRGDLQYQFEILKQKLASEGLFDLSIKKAIPKFPKKIAVITALQGAALQDFLNVMKRRAHWYHICVIPALVQGDKASGSLVEALDLALKVQDFEVIVFTRGGGAIEDLWPFNDEKLVRRIFNCPIPVISAVGHQVDFTLCDFVADLRCETPSAAAEILSQAQTELAGKLSHLGHKLFGQLRFEHSVIVKRLVELHPNRLLGLVGHQLQVLKQRLSEQKLTGRLEGLTKLHSKEQELDELEWRLNSALKNKMQGVDHRLEMNMGILRNLGPRAVLKRGYSYVANESGHVIKDIENFKKLPGKSKMFIQFVDGTGEVFKK